ncbi:MAG: SGNH/GDSL hydrolase family protein [Lachnospira sp.]|nr:SGNH/GDSL hydrolase family protein [Lachnospira sp.]
MLKKVAKVVAFLLIFVLGILGIQHLLIPKYVTDIKEGSMIEEYYKSEKNNDVLFIGSCQFFENISPVTMWEEYGITSYIRGSADQYIWQSYYLLEDALRYETPKVVVMNVHSLSIKKETVEESYNRMTIDGMKWSMSKVNAINASMTKDETFMSYLFPIVRYHSRWDELTEQDFKYYFNKPLVTTKGYLMQVGVRPLTTKPRVPVLADSEFDKENVEYLQKAADLCKEKGIKLVLLKAPSVFPHWYDEYDEQVEKFAKDNDLLYINAIEENEIIGIDYSTDTFDYGQHLNVQGAEKFSKYLGKVLDKEYNLADHRNDDNIAKDWNEVSKRYYEEKETKLKEWKE